MASFDLRRILTSFAFIAVFSIDTCAAQQDAPLTFNIPTQPMSAALNQLAIQANVQMFFEEATVRGLQAPAVVGPMSTRQALALLLANTRLEAVQDPDGTYVVRAKHHRPLRARRRAPAPETPAPVQAPPPPPAVVAAPVPEDGPWMLRLRGVYVDPKNESAPLVTPASAPAALPRDAVHANGLVHPEFDLEYFFAAHWSAELALGAPRRHEFGVNGAGGAGASSAGSFDWMSDVLTLKYHFLSAGPVRPYLGAGVNVTSFWDVSGAPFGLRPTSVGPAAQAGVDLKMGPHWFFNIDAKWARVRPELRYDGADVARPQFDPMMYALGLGYRFGGTAAGAPLAR
jgi:outer membrane protein